MDIRNLGSDSKITCNGHISCYYMTIYGGNEMVCAGEDSCNYQTTYNISIFRGLAWRTGTYSHYYNVLEVWG